ncbi:hypothetical protein NQZ79_g6749 [Umbelopsis isabellina]|nr:hypothetical protein NQZ79_g6749 [Umbelopsis isabellina]
MTASLSLKQIFEKSQLLTTHITNPELPPLDRGIDQIEHLSQDLVQNGDEKPAKIDIRAHYFLAKGGVNAQAMARHLDAVKLTSTFDLREPVRDTDVDGYLRLEHQRVVAHTVETGRCETAAVLERAYDKDLDEAWKLATKGSNKSGSQGTSLFKSTTESLLGLDEISGIAAKFGSDLQYQTLQQLLAPNDDDNPITFDSTSHPQLISYAKVIYNYNTARLHNKPIDIVSELSQVAPELASNKENAMSKFWPLVSQFTKGAEVGGDGPQSNTLYGPSSYKNRVNMIEIAETWLESQYVAFLNATVQRQPVVYVQSSPSSKIKTYINALHSTKSIPNVETNGSDQPWAVIYYHMRCGQNQEALDYINDNQNFFKNAPSIAEYFSAYIADLKDGAMSDLTRSRIQLEYDQMARNTAEAADPYKFAVYKIIGRCELNKRTLPYIISNTEDWLWLQLSLIRESQPGMARQSGEYTLSDLQQLLQRYGREHFDPHHNNPWNYIILLILTLQFEQAVHELYNSKLLVESAHLAIALATHGMLRTTTETNKAKDSLLIVNSDGQPAIKFIHMVHQYSLMFTVSNPEVAFQYLLTISALKDEGMSKERASELCRSYIEELVMETRAYSILLGCRTLDDKIEEGCIHEYKSLVQVDDAFIRKLAVAAADKCAHEERYTDAVALYYFAADHGKVVNILIRELGKELMQPSMRLPSDLENRWSLDNIPSNSGELVKYAKDVASRYHSSKPGENISEQKRATLLSLAKLHEFRYLYINGVAEQALDILNQTGIIPMDGDLTVIARKAEQLEDLDDTVVQSVPNLLLMTLTLFHEIYTISKQQGDTNVSNRNLLRIYNHMTDILDCVENDAT